MLDALRRDTGIPELGYTTEPAPLGHGFWAEILTFRLDGGPPSLAGELVAKIAPSGSHGEREAVVQAAVAAQGYPAPLVVARGIGPRPDDGCYFVMPRAQGAPPLADVAPGALARAVPALAVRLPALLADLAARLHRLEPEPLRAQLLSQPAWPVDVDDLVANIADARERLSDPAIAAAIGSLLDARPRHESRPVICHGDFHPLNVVVGPAGAVVVVDWTAARLAPPAFDVAYTALLLAHPPIDVGSALRRPLQLAGRWLARRFVSAYRQRARSTDIALPPEELSWYTRLHAARIIVDVAERGDHNGGHPYALMLKPATDLLSA